MNRLGRFAVSAAIALGVFVTGCSPPAAAGTGTICFQALGSTACGTGISTPTPQPTAIPTPTPTAVPTATPTVAPSPTPTPTPTPVANCTNGQFSAPSHYPDACWKPWATGSVWNTTYASYSPVPTVDSNSTTWQNTYAGNYPFIMGFGIISAANNSYGHPAYYGQSTDPQISVTCIQSYAICGQFSSMKWHIPTYARPAGGYANENGSDFADHHMAVIDQTNNSELDCWRVDSMSGGVLTANSCTYENVVTGDGLNGFETHSGFRLTAGVIRSQEYVSAIQNGTNLGHALFIVMPCTSNATPVFPAIYQGNTDTQCSGNAGPPYGQWFRLNRTHAQIDAATTSATYKRPIYYTLADYGGYIADTNGNGSVGTQVESDYMYTTAGYTNPGCPTTSPASGIPCTPLTAYFHSVLGDAGWNSGQGAYGITLTEIDLKTNGQWLDYPGN